MIATFLLSELAGGDGKICQCFTSTCRNCFFYIIASFRFYLSPLSNYGAKRTYYVV